MAAVLSTQEAHGRQVGAPKSAPKSAQLRPDLTLVPHRSGATARRILLVAAATFIAFVAIVGFEAKIAQNQMELDQLNKTVNLARAHYEELRQEKALLHAPDVLREEAKARGMILAPSIKFLSVSPAVVAVVDISIAAMDSRFADPPSSSLDAFGHLKANVKGDK